MHVQFKIYSTENACLKCETFFSKTLIYTTNIIMEMTSKSCKLIF